MKQYNAVFLCGGPGSGKDFILRTALKESSATEIPLPKLKAAINEKQDLAEVDGRPLIINGNADDMVIPLCKDILEAMGYSTAMVFVYTDNDISCVRSPIHEDKRVIKYVNSITMMHEYKKIFGESFFLFDNTNDFVNANEETQTQVIKWLKELTELVEGYFNETKAGYEKTVLGIRALKVPHQTGGVPEGGHPVPKGYERVKQGSFNVLRKKEPTPLEHQDDTNNVREEIDVLFEKTYPTIVDMIAQKKDGKQGDKYKGGIAVPGNKATSREVVETNQEISVPQTQAKGVKYSKNRPAKGARPPGTPYDSRIGTVPSGGVGLTAYHADETQPSKTLKQLREKKE